MDNELSQMLMIILTLMVVLLFVLVTVYIILQLKERKKKKMQEQKFNSKKDTAPKDKKLNTNSANTYTKESIFDFMEFDGIVDNMIVQKNGKRYIMIIECQGVNYDLMSDMEKISVEEGFQQFLNTLRHPIQIYIQTRTINLEKSISTYQKRVKDIQEKYNRTLYEYEMMKQNSAEYNKRQLEAAEFNITKQRNLYEYARDIVENTEKMSLNKNILSKKYYVILSYMPEEASSSTYDPEELRNIAFSELYTKAQALIRTLSACSVNGRILNSSEVIELLYVAYNRDESEVFGLEKAMKAEYEDLYSTAPDIFEKKMKVLDKHITDKSIDLANEVIDKVRAKSKAQKMAEEKEKRMDELINQMARYIIEDNRRVVGADIANEAVKEIKEQEIKGKNTQDKRGGEHSEKKELPATRRRK